MSLKITASIILGAIFVLYIMSKSESGGEEKAENNFDGSIPFMKDIVVLGAVSKPLSLAEVQAFTVNNVNVPASGTATQSSTDYGGWANRAIDGNTHGYYPKSSVTHTNYTNNARAWWRLDFSQGQPVKTIVVYNRQGDLGSRLSGAIMTAHDVNDN